MSEPVRIPVRRNIDRATFEAEILPDAQPVVLAELVPDWPIVRAARDSRASLARLIKGYDAGHRPHVIEAPAGAQGHIFYREDLTDFNFTRRPASLTDSVDRLLNAADEVDAPAIFLESISASILSTGLRRRASDAAA